MNCAVIFGGAGFIGVFFAQYLLENNHTSKVYLVDIEPVDLKFSDFRHKQVANDPRITFVKGDVREPLNWFLPSEKVTFAANFAAIHREPGHEQWEYYQTNLLGAENICNWAEKVKCNHIIFTSSISPYGVSEESKNEQTIPSPSTAYGASKLTAEKIHLIWQAKGTANRRLVIARPGVVFGPGEGGNVSRLIKAVLNRYFIYMGNRNTRKAGVYVKELCNALWWVYKTQDQHDEHISVFNMSMNPDPTIEDYVTAVCKVANVKRTVPKLPYKLLLVTAFFIDIFALPLKIKHPFSPVRIKKLVHSNNIIPGYLIDRNYQFIYTLESALTDWRISCPEEWK